MYTGRLPVLTALQLGSKDRYGLFVGKTVLPSERFGKCTWYLKALYKCLGIVLFFLL